MSMKVFTFMYFFNIMFYCIIPVNNIYLHIQNCFRLQFFLFQTRNHHEKWGLGVGNSVCK